MLGQLLAAGTHFLLNQRNKGSRTLGESPHLAIFVHVILLMRKIETGVLSLDTINNKANLHGKCPICSSLGLQLQATDMPPFPVHI